MKRSGNIYFGCCISVIGLFLYVLAQAVKTGENLTAYLAVVCVAAAALLLGVTEIIICCFDAETKKRGKESVATVVFVKKPENKDTFISNGKTYPVVYSYIATSGKEKRFKTYLRKNLAENLNEGDAVPIILYKERGLIDFKKLNSSIENL